MTEAEKVLAIMLEQKLYTKVRSCLFALNHVFEYSNLDWIQLLLGAPIERWESACEIARAMMLGEENSNV